MSIAFADAQSQADSAFIAGTEVPAAVLGALREVPDWRAQLDQLPQHLARDGCVLLRGALPRADVLAARHAVLQELASVGEIAEPAQAARASAFWRAMALSKPGWSTSRPSLRRASWVRSRGKP
jgi:hypothetical protein